MHRDIRCADIPLHTTLFFVHLSPLQHSFAVIVVAAVAVVVFVSNYSVDVVAVAGAVAVVVVVVWFVHC